MGIQNQCTVACGTAHKVVPCVPNDKAEIVGSSKVDCGFDVQRCSGEDDIVAVVPSRAGSRRGGGEGKAGVVCPVCPEVRDRVVGAGKFEV